MASEVTNNESWKPFYQSVPVTVIVGPESCKRTFYINQDLLIWHSEYFRVALNGRFSEGQTKVVRLEEDDPSAFERFVRYLFQNPCSGRDDAPWSMSSEDYPFHLIEFYVLGDKLLAEGFKQRIAADLKDFLKKDRTQMSALLTLAKSVYQLTSKGTGATMRNVLTWYCAVGMGDPRGPGRRDVWDSRGPQWLREDSWDNGPRQRVDSWDPAPWVRADSWVATFVPWQKDEKVLFLDCGLEEFHKDVLDMLCLTSGDPPEPELLAW